MKKISTLFIILFLSIKAWSQPVTEIVMASLYGPNNPTTYCLESYTLDFISSELLDGTASFTWGDTYYKYRIRVYNGNDEVLFQDWMWPSSYVSTQSTGYLYRYESGPNPEYLLNFTTSIIKFSIEPILFRYNNDPGLAFYFPGNLNTNPEKYEWYNCYNPNDVDSDGIPNSSDNCRHDPNADQADIDNDGKGDACDSVDNRDNDNDGINNSSDNCPDNYNPDQVDSDGDGIGDVCDSTDNNAKPDLTSDKTNIYIYSHCSGCQAQLSRLGSSRHIIYRYGGQLNFQQIVIDNKGTAASDAAKINYYFSWNNTYESGDVKIPGSTYIPSIPAGSYRVLSQTLFGSDFPVISSSNFYLIMKIDGDNQVTESKENNNIFVIPMKYQQDANGSFPPGGPIEEPFEFAVKQMQKPYDLHIYNFHGQLIKQVAIRNREDEQESIEKLPNGLYILNSVHGSRKIIKTD